MTLKSALKRADFELQKCKVTIFYNKLLATGVYESHTEQLF
jgi:hypothetical protein